MEIDVSTQIAADGNRYPIGTGPTDAATYNDAIGIVSHEELDQELVESVSTTGLVSAIPAASSVRVGHLYFASDDNGGTLYRSTGSAWVKVAAGVNETAGVEIFHSAITSNVAGLGNSASPVDITGLSGTIPAGITRPIMVEVMVPNVAYTGVSPSITAQYVAVRDGSNTILGFTPVQMSNMFWSGLTGTINGVATGSLLTRGYYGRIRLAAGWSGTVKASLVTGTGPTATVSASAALQTFIRAETT